MKVRNRYTDEQVKTLKSAVQLWDNSLLSRAACEATGRLKMIITTELIKRGVGPNGLWVGEGKALREWENLR